MTEQKVIPALPQPTHTLLAAARALVHEIAESGTHTRWKRLANALETEEERAQPPAAPVETEGKEWIVPHEDCLNCTCIEKCPGWKEHKRSSADSEGQWKLQHSVPSDGFECFYILKNGL